MKEIDITRGFLEALCKRPAMYMGNTQHQFTSLVSFIHGLELGFYLSREVDPPKKCELVPAALRRLITNHFGEQYPKCTIGWYDLIRQNTKSEKESFDLFFELRRKYDSDHSNEATADA